ncbi:MAG: hypothetical protein ACLGSH_11145 [Acidobacteriota bacterium]
MDEQTKAQFILQALDELAAEIGIPMRLLCADARLQGSYAQRLVRERAELLELKSRQTILPVQKNRNGS